ARPARIPDSRPMFAPTSLSSPEECRWAAIDSLHLSTSKGTSMTGKRARLGALTGVALAAAMLATASPAAASPAAAEPGSAPLIGRAVLPAATCAGGRESGQYIGAGPIGGQQVPFRHQPVQGFSALLPVRGAADDYWALADNGYGSEENSADFQLRIYRIRPD